MSVPVHKHASHKFQGDSKTVNQIDFIEGVSNLLTRQLWQSTLGIRSWSLFVSPLFSHSPCRMNSLSCNMDARNFRCEMASGLGTQNNHPKAPGGNGPSPLLGKTFEDGLQGLHAVFGVLSIASTSAEAQSKGPLTMERFFCHQGYKYVYIYTRIYYLRIIRIHESSWTLGTKTCLFQANNKPISYAARFHQKRRGNAKGVPCFVNTKYGGLGIWSTFSNLGVSENGWKWGIPPSLRGKIMINYIYMMISR